MLAPDVLVNFGGASGRAAFDQEWDLAEPDDRNVWGQLAKALRGGCARSDAARVIPSLLIQLEPYAEEDLADRVLILPGAKLYESIGVAAKDSRTTPWAVATVVSRVADWGTGVRLADGREGYIPDDDLYALPDYRLIIERRRGKWMITAFVAGD